MTEPAHRKDCDLPLAESRARPGVHLSGEGPIAVVLTSNVIRRELKGLLPVQQLGGGFFHFLLSLFQLVLPMEDCVYINTTPHYSYTTPLFISASE